MRAEPDELSHSLWLTHLATALLLVGLLWVVNYPLFAHVGAEQIRGYWREHTSLISCIRLGYEKGVGSDPKAK